MTTKDRDYISDAEIVRTILADLNKHPQILRAVAKEVQALEDDKELALKRLRELVLHSFTVFLSVKRALKAKRSRSIEADCQPRIIQRIVENLPPIPVTGKEG